MSNFHKINFPTFLALQAVSSTLFATELSSSASGREVRQSERVNSLQRYKINSCRLSAKQFEIFNAFFRARRGRCFSFLMRDYSDCRLIDQRLEVSKINPYSFEVIKIYDDFISPYKRRINKLVEGSVRLSIDGLDLKEAKIDHDKGSIVLDHNLMMNQNIVINAEFEVEVRFDSDDFQYYMDTCGSVVIDELRLIEVL